MQENFQKYHIIKKGRTICTGKILTMYNSLVLPHFNYCSTVWHDGNNAHMKNYLNRKSELVESLLGEIIMYVPHKLLITYNGSSFMNH